jgi:hypothetical protein
MKSITHNGKLVWAENQTRRARSGKFTFKSYFRYQWMRLKAWTWKWTKRVAFALATGGILFGAYVLGTANGATVTATNIITPATEAQLAPVMERIATAESKGHQYGASGQVLIHVNNNGTVDLGKYQINSIWFSLATKLGYDLTKEKDNEAFALYLYANRGTGPWASSSANW